MKKTLTLITALTIAVSNFFFSTHILSADFDTDSVKAELQSLKKLYEENDYSSEDWVLLEEAYNNGLAAIEASEDIDSAYRALNSAAESMISIDHRGGSVKVCVSVEKLTLDKGFIVLPGFVRVRKYERASQVISDFLNETYDGVTRTPYSSSGTIEHNFELTGVYESYVDTGDDEYDEIDVPNYLTNYVGKYLPQRDNKGYIRKGDYTDESCFVFSVNNKFPNVSASAIPVLDEDVLRWHFSIYGNGADVGAVKYNSEPVISKFPDKGELLWKMADVNEKNDLGLLLSDADNQKRYNDAMIVLEKSNISQTAVDRALDKLEALVPITELPSKPDVPENTEPDDNPDTDENTEAPDIETPSPSITFNDVPENHFAYEYVNYLAEKGILSGRTETEFDPDGYVTRAEFVVMLSRAAGHKNSDASVFEDVPENAWYSGGVAFAYNSGITNGTSEKTFSPDDRITREQLAAMLKRFADFSNITLEYPSGNDAFSDESDIADYALESVAVMQASGIIGGRDNNSFAPKANATRAETAKTLALLLKMQ